MNIAKATNKQQYKIVTRENRDKFSEILCICNNKTCGNWLSNVIKNALENETY